VTQDDLYKKIIERAKAQMLQELTGGKQNSLSYLPMMSELLIHIQFLRSALYEISPPSDDGTPAIIPAVDFFANGGSSLTDLATVIVTDMTLASNALAASNTLLGDLAGPDVG
jgi:hypothetical protein